MEKLTGAEVLERLETLEEMGILTPQDFVEYGTDVDSFDYSDGLDSLDDEDRVKAEKILEELGESKIVRTDSPDSEWDYYERTINFFPKHDVYIETRGHYTSYVGTEYEDGLGTVVKPVEKVFTVYEVVE